MSSNKTCSEDVDRERQEGDLGQAGTQVNLAKGRAMWEAQVGRVDWGNWRIERYCTCTSRFGDAVNHATQAFCASLSPRNTNQSFCMCFCGCFPAEVLVELWGAPMQAPESQSMQLSRLAAAGGPICCISQLFRVPPVRSTRSCPVPEDLMAV